MLGSLMLIGAAAARSHLSLRPAVVAGAVAAAAGMAINGLIKIVLFPIVMDLMRNPTGLDGVLERLAASSTLGSAGVPAQCCRDLEPDNLPAHDPPVPPVPQQATSQRPTPPQFPPNREIRKGSGPTRRD